MVRRLCIVAACLATSGCMATFNQTPYVTYQGTRPLSDTSVFSTADLPGDALGQILSIDGVKASCWKVGCPIWARVTPGSHSFVIRYRVFNNGIYSYKQGFKELKINNMAARHVYVAVFTDYGKTYSVGYKDLGENAKYGVTLGLKGYNREFFPVKF